MKGANRIRVVVEAAQNRAVDRQQRDPRLAKYEQKLGQVQVSVEQADRLAFPESNPYVLPPCFRQRTVRHCSPPVHLPAVRFPATMAIGLHDRTDCARRV